MSNQIMNVAPKGRPVGGTEHSWCKGVIGGTGIAVLALLSSKNHDLLDLEKALHQLQNANPILMCNLHYNANTFSFQTSKTHPFIKIKSFDIPSTSKILQALYNNQTNYNHNVSNISPLQLILEDQLNENVWCDRNVGPHVLLFANNYALPDTKTWLLTLRLHVAACDRTTAVSLLKQLLVLMGGDHDEKNGDERIEMEIGNKGEISLGIEDLIPNGKGRKGLWTRGMDMLGYSMSSLRLSNLKFKDTKQPRFTQIVRLQINKDDTQRILQGCKANEIKLCAALSAAGLLAAYNSERDDRDHQRKKYGVITLTDCRSILEPPLSAHHFGFYHSAILNTQTLKGGEKLWQLAKIMYTTLENSKKCNKHFSDMSDLNFLMCKAVENPSLTPSSALRTSFLSVFEDTVIHNYDEKESKIGLMDYMGCASVHGIGPSMGVFDTIRNEELDCVIVYPTPLHSRDQMEELVHDMKTILCQG